MVHLVHFLPQKRPKKHQKRGYYTLIWLLFRSKNAIFSAKIIKKRLFLLNILLFFDDF